MYRLWRNDVYTSVPRSVKVCNIIDFLIKYTSFPPHFRTCDIELTKIQMYKKKTKKKYKW